MGDLRVYNQLVKPAAAPVRPNPQKPLIHYLDPKPTVPLRTDSIEQLKVPKISPANLPAEGLRFVFMSDNHSRPDLLNQLIDWANIEDPDLVLDGGDTINDGTESELNRANQLRQRFESPLYQVTGNHDAHLRGPFKTAPTELPDFQSMTLKGVHFILLDNEDETLTDEQFQKLEADLKAHAAQPTFVAMHVPPKLSKTPLSVKVAKVLPLNFASPVMRKPEQVARFHQLMKDHGVKAVLAGHTHYPDELTEDGVRYVTVSTSGGLSPKPGVPKQFLDIRVNQGEVDIQRVNLEMGKGVVGYVGEAFDFYKDLNRFNHESQGWEGFEPTANVGYTAGFRQVSTERGSSVAATVGVQAERPMGPKQTLYAGLGVSAGSGKDSDYGLQTELGYRYAVAGDYGKGVYVAGAATSNSGYLHGQASFGVGAKAAVGVQYKNWRAELGQEWNTQYQAQTLTVGFRF